MSVLSANPWSFVPSDVLTATPAASPTGFVLNADGTVTLTTTAAHGFTQGQFITAINATAAVYNGFYKILAVPSATTATLLPLTSGGRAIPSGTAASGGGTVALNQFVSNTRVEDISWQNAQASGHQLDIRDQDGNPIWLATAAGVGQQNRGKIFWVEGITIFTLQSGIVLMTVN